MLKERKELREHKGQPKGHKEHRVPKGLKEPQEHKEVFREILEDKVLKVPQDLRVPKGRHRGLKEDKVLKGHKGRWVHKVESKVLLVL